MTQNSGWTGMVETIDETEFGVFPSDPAMAYIGVVDGTTINDKAIINSMRYLPQDAYASDTNGYTRSSAYLHKKVSSEIGIEISYIPKGVESGFFLHALGKPVLVAGSAKTGATDGLGASFSLAGYATAAPEYFVYTGGYVEDFTMEIPKDDFVKCSATLGFANSGSMAKAGKVYTNTNNMLSSDYIGSGSHAADSIADALTFESVTASVLTPNGGSAVTDIVNSISIKVTNNLEWIKDLGSPFTTGRSAAVLNGRDITLSIELTYDDLNLYEDIFGGKDFTYEMTLDGYDFEFGGFKFPEYPIDLNPEELIGETIESTQVTNIKITKPTV